MLSSLLLVIILSIPVTVLVLQKNTDIQQHASDHDEDDDAVETTVNAQQITRADIWKIVERYRVCRKNHRPKKCWKNVEALLPPGLKDRIRPTVTPEPTTPDSELPVSTVPDQSPTPTSYIGPVTTDTPTPTPYATGWVTQPVPSSSETGQTQITVTVCPHGLGNCGDNVVSPSSAKTDPVHTTRSLSMSVYSLSNQLVTTKQITVTYSAGAGNFTGTSDFSDVPSGNYIIKMQLPGYLSGAASGVQSIIANQLNYLPPVYLITGDINADNIINIQDYIRLTDCYGDLTQNTTCTDEQKTATDLNDDGQVNFIDYNLFIREISSQKGI